MRTDVRHIILFARYATSLTQTYYIFKPYNKSESRNFCTEVQTIH